MTIEELEKAVATLAPEDYQSFRAWFVDYDMVQWDKQIEADSKAGRLDSMIHEALADYNAGRATDLHS